MYQEFFGLQEDPFRVNPDPRYLFLTPGTQEALMSLAYGIRNRYGMIVMTGEVGTGKTTLLHAILDGLRLRTRPRHFGLHSSSPAWPSVR